MLTRAPYTVVRWTHTPTGVTVQADGHAHAKNVHARVRWAADMARRHLLAKLCQPEVTPIRRSYHLAPYLGLEPFVSQDGRRIAEGREAINAMLNGRIPEGLTR